MFILESSSVRVTAAALASAVALINPALALIRWLQEVSANHRCREEMSKCDDILKFIQQYPEMESASGAKDLDVLKNARLELGRSLKAVNDLLKKKSPRETAPKEIAWPRRWLLLYRPRSWAAIALHTLYHLVTLYLLLAIWGFGFNDTTDTFQLSEYAQYLQSPGIIFIGSYLFWLLFLQWYATTTKDRWDGVLPTRSHGSTSRWVLSHAPLNVRELVGRLLLMSSGVDLLIRLLPTSTLVRWFGGYSSALDGLVKSLPRTSTLESVLGWVGALTCPVLAYCWIAAEHALSDKQACLRFPHNLRFLYPPSGMREVLAQIVIIFLIVEAIISTVRFKQALSTAFALVTGEDRNIFLIGFVISSTWCVITAFGIPIYAAYRFGLISFLMRMNQSVLSNQAQTARVG